MLRVYQIITQMMIWTTQAQTGSTNLVGASSLHQHVLPLFPSITSLRFLLSHPPPCLRPFSYMLFLKSSLDPIHIHPSICVSPCCSFSLHRCVGFLSALERRVLLLAKAFSPSPPQVSCRYRWRMQLGLSPPPQAPLWRTWESTSCII